MAMPESPYDNTHTAHNDERKVLFQTPIKCCNIKAGETETLKEQYPFIQANVVHCNSM